MALGKKIETIAMATGTKVEYQVPNDVAVITFQPVGGDVKIHFEEADPGFTFFNGGPYTYSTRAFANSVVYFAGATGVTVEVQYFTGQL